MEAFTINGKEIHSLEELRQNFDIKAVTAAFLDQTLERWLSDCFYEHQADSMKALDHVLGDETERELCRILGIDYEASGIMTEEQRAVYERKCNVIRQYSDDTSLLAHAFDTATNQAELADFLHNGKRTIYLCGGSFQVPIRVSGIHYIGIGNPKMEAPFTEEQYKRAGITFEGIALPTIPTKETLLAAEKAAAEHGYDNFAERHNALASLVHFSTKGHRLSTHLRLKWDLSVASEFYKSKTAAENAAQREIDTTYEQANSFFSPGCRTCISNELSERYAALISKGCGSLAKQLSPWCSGNTILKQRLLDMDQKIVSAAEELHRRFDRELSESSDYYSMYKRSYFHERVDIEMNDYNLDLFESSLLNGLARLFHDESEYFVNNLHETISEMEEDVNSHADTFFGRAYEEYCNYCAEIEEIAEEIGADLSDDDMDNLGIKRVNA